jgi:chaperone required for assembly of F1-ATPase
MTASDLSHASYTNPAGLIVLSETSIYRLSRCQSASHPDKPYVFHINVFSSSIHPRAGAEATLKRFWKTVDLQERGDALAITLDSRPLKTPGGKPLLLPRSKRLAATLIVSEWENQRNVLKSHALPMVGHPACHQAVLCPSTNAYKSRPHLQHARLTQ